MFFINCCIAFTLAKKIPNGHRETPLYLCLCVILKIFIEGTYRRLLVFFISKESNGMMSSTL